MATYENPAFGLIHVLREIEGAGITSNNAITNTEKGYLFDSRRELFQFDGSASDHYLDFDRGAGSLDGVDRLVVFSGHNWTGTIDLIADDDGPTFPSATTLLNNQAVSAGLLDLSFTENSERYIRLSWDGTGQWSMPEVWLTKRRTMDRGPVWPWVDTWKYNVLDFEKPTGTVATLERGTKQRVFNFSWRKLILAADILVFDDLFDYAGRVNPFLFWPPYGEDPVLVKLTNDPEREPGAANPGQNESRNIRLEMIELTA